MEYADDIIVALGVVTLAISHYCRVGIRHAYDRWVEHRDHVAHVKHQQFEYVAMRERINRLVAGLEPDKRENSTVDQ